MSGINNKIFLCSLLLLSLPLSHVQGAARTTQAIFDGLWWVGHKTGCLKAKPSHDNESAKNPSEADDAWQTIVHHRHDGTNELQLIEKSEEKGARNTEFLYTLHRTNHPNLHLTELDLPNPTSWWKKAFGCCAGTPITSTVFVISNEAAYILAEYLEMTYTPNLIFVYIVANGCILALDLAANKKQRAADHRILVAKHKQKLAAQNRFAKPEPISLSTLDPENEWLREVFATTLLIAASTAHPAFLKPLQMTVTYLNIANVGDHCGTTLLMWIEKAQTDPKATLDLAKKGN